MRSNLIDKIPNTNTLIQNSRANHSLLFHNFKSNERIYISDKFIKQLQLDLIDWVCKQTKATSIQHFLNLKGYKRSSFREWCQKYPELETIKQDARAILGAMREDEAMYNKNCNYPVIMATLAVYSEEWSEAERIKAEFKAKAQATQQTSLVVGIPTYQYDVIPAQQQAVIPVDDKKQE